MRTQRHQLRGEHPVGGQERLDAHRRGHVGDPKQRGQVRHGEGEHPEHPVGAVDQREPLLRRELDRRQPGGGQRLGRVPQLAGLVADLPLADQCEGDVRQGGEVARAPEAAVLAHDRGEPRVEQPRERLDDLQAHAGVAGHQGAQAHQHHRAGDLTLDLGTRAGSVRTDQGALQLGPLLDGDVPGRQRTEAGRHAVRRLVTGRQRLDVVAGPDHRGPGTLGQLDPRLSPGDRDDVGERQGVGPDQDRALGVVGCSPASRHMTSSVSTGEGWWQTVGPRAL